MNTAAKYDIERQLPMERLHSPSGNGDCQFRNALNAASVQCFVRWYFMKRGTCKHFNGTWQNKQCLAGVCYEDVTPDSGDNLGIAFRIPCRIIKGREYEELNLGQKENYERRGQCDKFEEPTDDEIREADEAIESAVQRHMRTLPLIAKVKDEQEGRDWQGIVPCPVCAGKLHLSHAAYNGHVWGRCDTKDCLAWME